MAGTNRFLQVNVRFLEAFTYIVDGGRLFIIMKWTFSVPPFVASSFSVEVLVTNRVTLLTDLVFFHFFDASSVYIVHSISNDIR
ncbi:hypothetical protein TU51_19780 [Bacillus cytotoxicus]|nr:hypothetical protein CG482_011130 [Bacillus cytotoxicus]AWC36927.1 hypothetical protein CG481_011145 [Bacillus cytotoxicus]AWC61190.1 hypothetical protein CG474_011205 [Bacillus cytotoxicus]KMT48373.1 hypothetical protein TU51_19780 [Bacillus cytotoxicus]